MSEAQDFINDLDDELTSSGNSESVVLTRSTRVSGTLTAYTVTLPAFIRRDVPVESQGGQVQQTAHFIMSPTMINATGWPSGAPAVTGRDPRVPRSSDTIQTSKGIMTVLVAVGIMNGGLLIRIEGTATGEQG